jgi:hypothetical protein
MPAFRACRNKYASSMHAAGMQQANMPNSRRAAGSCSIELHTSALDNARGGAGRGGQTPRRSIDGTKAFHRWPPYFIAIGEQFSIENYGDILTLS